MLQQSGRGALSETLQCVSHLVCLSRYPNKTVLVKKLHMFKLFLLWFFFFFSKEEKLDAAFKLETDSFSSLCPPQLTDVTNFVNSKYVSFLSSPLGRIIAADKSRNKCTVRSKQRL